MTDTYYPSCLKTLATLQKDTSLTTWDCPFCGRTPHDTIFTPGHLGTTEIMAAAKQLFEENVQLVQHLDAFKTFLYGSDEYATNLDNSLTMAALHETRGLLYKIEGRLELCMTGSLVLMLSWQEGHPQASMQEGCDLLLKALNEAAVGLTHLRQEVGDLAEFLGLSNTSGNGQQVSSTDTLNFDKLTLN